MVEIENILIVFWEFVPLC